MKMLEQKLQEAIDQMDKLKGRKWEETRRLLKKLEMAGVRPPSDESLAMTSESRNGISFC